MTRPATRAGSTSAPITIPPPSPSPQSVVGGRPWANSPIRSPRNSSSPPTAGVPTTHAPACGRHSPPSSGECRIDTVHLVSPHIHLQLAGCKHLKYAPRDSACRVFAPERPLAFQSVKFNCRPRLDSRRLLGPTGPGSSGTRPDPTA